MFNVYTCIDNTPPRSKAPVQHHTHQQHLVYIEYVLYDINLVPRLPDLFNVAISDLFQCIIVCKIEELHGNRAWQLDII